MCPVQHEGSDESFGEGRIQDRIVVLVCPKCGIVFSPKGEKSSLEKPKDEPQITQIVKWP